MPKPQNIKLARLWVMLDEMKTKIDNEIVPLGAHLGIEDPNLMVALEALSEKIEDHFRDFRLEAVRRGKL